MDSVHYLTPPELVRRAMIAASEAMAMEVTSADRKAAFDLDRRMVSRVLSERPNLSANGFWAEGCQSREAFAIGRVAMLSMDHLGQFERALAFLLLCCGRRKTMNRRVTSYGLKHSAERALRGLHLGNAYVSNGACIVAAIALGYRIEHIQGTPNAWCDINVVRGAVPVNAASLDLRTIARALGGEVQGRQVLAPGPNHGRRDRSLSVRLSAQSPTGFIVFSHAGDDFRDARDYVAARLGLGPDAWRREQSRQVGDSASRPGAWPAVTVDNVHGDRPDNAARIARARAIWDGAGPAPGSIVETYLASRGLQLDLVYDVHEVIRFSPRCPWRDEAAGVTIYVPAMVAALRQIQGDEITGVHRTRLTNEGAKVDRRMLGLASGAAIKLDADDAVTMGLAIGEGVETVMQGRQLGFRPGWALGSAGAISAFPALGGIEALTILAENDATNRKAVEACASRWHCASREVTIIEPASGSDLNDAARCA